MAQVKIQIKSIFGEVLFEYEKEHNTIKDTVEEAVRQKASLYRANLDGASLDGASLNGASLDGASLYRASLNGASLNGASLDGANLDRANLDGASLDGASLNGASLDGASLYRASLNGASLYRAKNIPYIPLNCPSDGAFVGWKKVDGKLVQLLIPEDVKRSSATTMKCRCDKAKVLAITSLDGTEQYDSVLNTNYTDTEYKVGEMVYPDKFDDDRWNECSSGIHFFINKQDAINY